MRKFSIILLIALLLPTILCACSDGDDDTKITVGVTIAPEAAFVKGVCKDSVNVITAVPSGASPESYDPSPKEILELSKADVYFSIGLPSEQNVLPALADNTRIVKLDEAVAEKIPDLKQGDARDPHIWLSVRRAKIMVELIRDTMIELDSENSQLYTDNADSFLGSLDTTDTEIREMLSALESKKFIVFHPAFAYFADEYGLEMHSLEEEGKEVSASDMQRLTDLARENGIRVIFYQAQTAKRQAEAFAEGIDGEAIMLDPLSESYIENLKIMAEKIAEAK